MQPNRLPMWAVSLLLIASIVAAGALEQQLLKIGVPAFLGLAALLIAIVLPLAPRRPQADSGRQPLNGLAACLALASAVFFRTRYLWTVPAGYGFLWNLKDGSPSLGIAIRDGYQDQGLGRVLMQFLVDAARSRACRNVKLTVYDDNPRARHLYEQFGFTTRRLVHHMQADL